MLKPSRALQASLSLDLFGRAHKMGEGTLSCLYNKNENEGTNERENEKKLHPIKN